MPHISFKWPEGRFATDCMEIAKTFLRGPDSFQPGQSRNIVGAVREKLLAALMGMHTEDTAKKGLNIDVDGVELTVREQRPSLPFR